MTTPRRRRLRWTARSFPGRGLVDTAFNARNRFWHLVLLVGVASGVTGAVYIGALKALTKVLSADAWSDPAHLVVLGVVGLAIGVITLVLGNPGDVELLVDNIHVNGGRSDIRDLRALIPVSLLGIAAGSAIGPEAPLVQTTGSIGNWGAIRRNLGMVDARSLTITGMAAGFAVLFGAPLGSAIFALEILHRRGLEYYEALLPAALGALTGFALYIGVNRIGFQPVWHFPEPHDLRAIDLVVGVVAGLIGAAVASGFTYFARLEQRGFRLLPPALRPVVGGLALGGLAFASPYALTFGEPQIQHVVDARLAIGTLLLAAAAKFVASSTIISAGWRGGFIIPLFFMGAALGSAMAQIFHVDPVIAMAAGMTACNVGVTKTPYGSTLVVAEMAGMRLIPSTFLAALVSLFLTSRVSMIHAQRTREGAFDEPTIDRAAGAPAPAGRTAVTPGPPTGPTADPANSRHGSPEPRTTAPLDGAHPGPATSKPRPEGSTG